MTEAHKTNRSKSENGRRRQGAILVAAALALVIVTIVDPSSRSSLIWVQQLSPYFIGSLSVALATVGVMRAIRRRSFQVLFGCVGIVSVIALIVAGVITFPPGPSYTLDAPGSDSTLLVTRDSAFLDPSYVVTVRTNHGLDSQEWYVTCFDNFPGFYRAEWLSPTHMRLFIGDAGSNEASDFSLDPQTGAPTSTGSCQISSSGLRPGVRTPH